ncbi:MAG: VWA domain-containing protein [Bacteroides sp.]|nr:VWA domain-containing protein [Bacteroides sp.]
MNLHFAHPEYLWFLLIIIPCVAWYIYSCRTKYASLSISSLKAFDKLGRSWKQYFIYVLFGIRMLALAALIIVLARPQSSIKWSNSKTNGTDIVIALDISSSMLAGDFDPNRLEAAKKVAGQFITARENDNIGLVVFAAESFTAVPMTADHSQLINYLNEVEVGLLEDNTAIGDGLATAINRIRDGKAKSKSIILLTDGSHNAGQLTPADAAEIAKLNDIKIYTIGVGRNGTAPYPQVDQFGRVYNIQLPVVIDEKTLTSIADQTGGKYFRAENERVLSDVFDEIDKLETTEISVRKFAQQEEDYLPWALLALGLFIFEIVCRATIVRPLS